MKKRVKKIIILGGGIIGCSLADELARSGQKVMLIEKSNIGSEASTAAPGILSAQTDLTKPDAMFDLCSASRKLYPRWIMQLERRSKLSIGYRVPGVLYLATRGRSENLMKRQLKWQTKRGLRVERLSRRSVRRREPGVDKNIRCGFSFPSESQVNTDILMKSLTISARKAGVDIKEQVEVKKILLEKRHVKGVETDRGVFNSSVVVNCLGSWASMNKKFPLYLPIEPRRGQIIEFKAPRRVLRHIIMSDRGYAVQRKDRSVLIGSTVEPSGFDKSVTLDGIHSVLGGLRSVIGRALEQCSFVGAWSGLRPWTPDQIPIMGDTHIRGLYVSTGHFKHGILLAPITAHLMTELILRGGSTFDLTPFSPTRFHK